MLTNPLDDGGGGGRLGGSGGSGFDSAAGNSCGGAPKAPGGCIARGLNCGFLFGMVRVVAMGADVMICRWS